MNTYQQADPAKLRGNVPADLKPLPIWLLWKSGSTKGPEGKAPKVPHYADGKRRGATDTPSDRSRLVTFDEVMAVYEMDMDRYFGPGIALGKVPDTAIHESGIDLDNCVRDGLIAPKAQQVIDAAGGSYVERSPSGNGLKIFGTGDIGTTKEPELEIYSAGRFFTVTGEHVSGNCNADLSSAAALARALLLQQQQSDVPGPGIPDGKRNSTLYAYARSLRDRIVDKDEAWQAFQARAADCQPPLGERELRQIFEGAWRSPPGFQLTDTGNAERFAAQHDGQVRFLIGGGWHVFSGHRFVDDRREPQVVIMLTAITRSIYIEAARTDDDRHRKALSDWARQCEARGRVEAALALAEPRMSERLEQYDANPYLIGLSNGVYDLKADTFRPGTPEDRITLAMNVAYDPKATCPRWEKFQLEIHEGDTALVAFKQRAWGYTMSGDVSEQKFFLCHGDGANGKTTEQNVVLHLQGEYAKKIEPETLLVKQRNGANNDVARIRGARFLATVEVEDGKKLAESLVKQLTGGDRLAARFLYQEIFEFKPTAKIWIASNHKPEITGTDYAIWRRILLIPYPVQFSKEHRDPRLQEALITECPGILNWMLEGYRQWAEHNSLAPPDAVLGATEEYRAEMDRVGNFLKEVCNFDYSAGRTDAAKLYRTYRNWMKANGLFPLSAKKFHERMERDHNKVRVMGNGGIRSYPGLQIVCRDYDHDDGEF